MVLLPKPLRCLVVLTLLFLGVYAIYNVAHTPLTSFSVTNSVATKQQQYLDHHYDTNKASEEEQEDDDNSSANTTTDHEVSTRIKRQRPLLVLHVGPGKTGTTSIQNALDQSKTILGSDNYKYLGNNGAVLNKAASYHCDTTTTTTTIANNKTKTCLRVLSPKLLAVLNNENEDQQQKHLVGSNEFLTLLPDDSRRAWVNATQDTRDVKIVVSYRRLFEILPSLYNQRYRHDRITKPPSIGHAYWPGIHGYFKLPTLPEHLANLDFKNYVHISVKAYHAWRKDFPVSLFHVHQEGDLTTNFVCQEISGATETCQRLKSNQNNASTTANPSSDMVDNDILAVHAYEQGLVHELDNRKDLSFAINDHRTRLNRSMPIACPEADVLHELYSVSWKFESWAMTTSKPLMFTEFNASWDKTLEKLKLCSMNSTAALEQEVWQDFFRDRHTKVEEKPHE